jgi:ribosome maturation factor RimP
MDAHDPIAGQYALEISSPGIDRPLARASDFDDWAGHEAKLETRELIDGRKRFRGVIIGRRDDTISLTLDPDQGGETIDLPIASISEARLVLTDDLIRETQRRTKKHVEAMAASEDEDN